MWNITKNVELQVEEEEAVCISNQKFDDITEIAKWDGRLEKCPFLYFK